MEQRHNAEGKEVLDTTPVARNIPWSRPLTIQEQIQRYIRMEMSRDASEHGNETFEEADDFDVGDDYDPRSPWELSADQESVERERLMEDGNENGTPAVVGGRSGEVDSSGAGTGKEAVPEGREPRKDAA